jgi:choline dehydrogenase-like flavoprotein
VIVDLAREESLPEFRADVCIVGAGAAGIVLAVELERQGKRVLLLESGGATLEAAAQELNELASAGQQRRGANIGRFRMLGGTTTAWGGQVQELCAEDFSQRPWVQGSGWPFTKEELDPYYQRALMAEGLAESIPDDNEVWRQLKISAPELGDAFATYFTRWCPEPNFARLYGNTLRQPNLRVVVHATATAMQFTEDGSRVRGISCRTLSGREQVFSAARYVLCLGTIESVRFLLQPSAHAKALPWNRSSSLGQHFQSHIDWNTAVIPASDAGSLQRRFANVYLDGYKYHPKFRLEFSSQERQEILNVAGSITCINAMEMELRRTKSMVRELLSGRLPDVRRRDISLLARQLPTLLQLAYGYRVRKRAAWPKDSAFWLRVHCEQEPLSKSRITLTETRDQTGLFRAHLDWRISPLEWKTIRYFTDRVRRGFAELGLAQILPQTELAIEEGFRNITFDDSHHHMGGTRMSRSPSEGVVNPDLKLHGVENAYVCSASVFPTSGFSNPTHTLIALAIRLADHLTGEAHASNS